MFTKSHHCADGRLYERPFVHDLAIAESEHAVPALRQHRIPPTIPLESVGACVMLAPIHLDDQPVTDKEVDAANPGDVNLSPDAPPEPWETDPQQGLDAGFAHPIDPTRRMATRERMVRHKQPLVKGTIKCNGEVLEVRATFQVSQCFLNRSDGVVDDAGTTPPVHDERRVSAVAPASMIIGISRTNCPGR